MTGDSDVTRCDWLQQARIEISSNTIIFHDETFVKMATVEDIINKLSEERQRCYRAHSDAEIRQQEPDEKELVTLAFAAWLKKRDELGEIGITEFVTVTGEYLGGVYSAGWKQGYEAAINLRSATPIKDNQTKPENNNGIPNCCGVNCPDLSQGCKDHCPHGYDHEKATASEQKKGDIK